MGKVLPAKGNNKVEKWDDLRKGVWEKKSPYEWMAQTLWNNEFKDWLQAFTLPCDEHRQATETHCFIVQPRLHYEEYENSVF